MHIRLICVGCAAALSGLFSCVSAQAQSPGGWRTARLTDATNEGDAYNETSIAVSATNPNHFIVTCNFQRPPYQTGPFRRVYYGISTNAIDPAAPFSQRGELPVPTTGTNDPNDWQWFDPMTAASQTGDTLWAGSIWHPIPVGSNTIGGFAVWRNPAGTGGLSFSDPGVIPTTQWQEDKGLMCVGPSNTPGHLGEEVMYLGWTRKNFVAPTSPAGPFTVMMWRRSTDGLAPGAGWANPESKIDPDLSGPNDDRLAFGVAPVVFPLTASAAVRRRLLVAYGVPIYGLPYNYARIETTYRNDPEVNSDQWGPSLQFDQELPVVQAINVVNHLDSFPGSIVVGNHPSVAIDPVHPDTVYIAFIGSTTAPSVFPNPPVDQNVDIYIARSTSAGASIPGQPAFQLVVRLTDAMLGDPDGTDQFQPTVTVDGFGGLHLAYLRVPPRNTWPYDPAGNLPFMDVSHVRMATFPPMGTLSVARLTGLFRPFPEGAARFGDYITIAASGCKAYVAYPKWEDGPLHLCNVYVTQVMPGLCPADTDDSGLVDSGDVGAFAVGFSQGTARTDMNHDGVHSGADVESFLNAYACGCAQQP